MKLLALIKKRFVENMTWVRAHYDLIVLCGGVVLMLGFVFIGLSWIVGYWANGLLGTRFELNSCIQGIGAICGGTATLWTVAKAAMDKYKIDSELNSKPGEMPAGKEKK